MDGHHKLIMYNFIIHGCIDGYSRKLIYLECCCDNLAATVLKIFKEGVSRSGLPHRVRGDHGGENVEVANFLADCYGEEGRYIFGTSTHNQRIERMWRDVGEKVVSPLKDLFITMEESDILDINNALDVFCLQYVYLPRIQEKLDFLTEAWNNHRVRTMDSTPNQAWEDDMQSQQLHVYTTSSVNINRSEDSAITYISRSSYLQSIPRNSLRVWIQESIALIPNPLVEDGRNGVQHFLNLRAHLSISAI